MARKVKVGEETPRTLWCRAESASAGGGSAGGGSTRNPCDTPSPSRVGAIGANAAASEADRLVSSRVPPTRVTSIVCMLPATGLTAGGFRWRDGVKEIYFAGCVDDVYSTYPDDSFSDDDSPDPFFEALEVLSFQECSDGPLDPGRVPLPPGLKTAYFGGKWNIELHGTGGGFPDSLEYVTFPRYFDQPPAGGDARLLPPGLREIYLGSTFNQSLLGVIWPKGLETLQFGNRFNQVLAAPDVEGGAPIGNKSALPDGLKNLYMGEDFDLSLSESLLPAGLEELSLGIEFDFTASCVRWPSQLKRLYVGSQSLFDPYFISVTLPMELPPQLELLRFWEYFNLPLTVFAWPPTLKVLDLGDEFDHPIGEAGNVPLLPDGLEELRVGTSFNHGIENVRLPIGLKRLIIDKGNWRLNQGLAGVMWPPGLEELNLGNMFNQPLQDTTFPETLRKLSLGDRYSHSLGGVTLPAGLAVFFIASN